MLGPQALFLFEECWTLVGERRAGLWLARRIFHVAGRRIQVEFNARRVLRREETRGDVIGFLHTHPSGHPGMSLRDLRTMKAWCGAFGKPLLCVIQSDALLNAYRFDDDESNGTRLRSVEIFSKGTIVGVDEDAGQASPRTDVPRQRSRQASARGPLGVVRSGRARFEPGG